MGQENRLRLETLLSKDTATQVLVGREEAVASAHAVSALLVHGVSVIELEHGFAAIHMNRLSGNVAGLFGCQKSSNMSYVFRPAYSP
jgi:hypothetical protein